MSYLVHGLQEQTGSACDASFVPSTKASALPWLSSPQQPWAPGTGSCHCHSHAMVTRAANPFQSCFLSQPLACITNKLLPSSQLHFCLLGLLSTHMRCQLSEWFCPRSHIIWSTQFGVSHGWGYFHATALVALKTSERVSAPVPMSSTYHLELRSGLAAVPFEPSGVSVPLPLATEELRDHFWL